MNVVTLRIVRKQAAMYALVAEMQAESALVDGMKATNAHHPDGAGPYCKESFDESHDSLQEIARRLREEI